MTRSVLVHVLVALMCTGAFFLHGESAGADDFFAPISTITNVIKYGDQTTTTQHTATFRCTEMTPGGRFQIGNETFQVTCVPPRYTYLLNEYSRIPRKVELHKERACLVGNVEQFNASLKFEEAKRATALADATRRRRLLFFDPVGTGIAIAAIVIATKAQATADAAWDLGKANEHSLNAVNVAVNDLQAADKTIQTSITNLEAGQKTIVADLSHLKNAANYTLAAYETLLDYTSQLASKVEENENQLRLDLLDSKQALVDGLNTQYDIFSRSILNNTDLDREREVRSQKDVQSLFEQIQMAQENLLGLHTSVFDLYQNVQLRDMLTKSFFESKRILSSSLEAMLTDAGAAPFNNGQLLGADLRILVDTLMVNFVVPVGSTTTVVNYQFNIYMDAYEAVKQSRPWTTFESLLKSIGPDPQCWRSYEGSDVLDANVVNSNSRSSKCVIWIEVVRKSCPLAAGIVRQWKNMTTGLPERLQPITLDADTCPSTISTGISTQTSLIRNFREWQTFVSENVCKQDLVPTYFQLYVQSLDAIMYVQQNKTTCDYTFSQLQMMQKNERANSIFGYMFTLLQFGFPNLVVRVYSTRMKINGRLPGGLTFENEPLVYTPTQRDEQGNVILDGGADPHQCMSAYWLAMSRDTLPIMSVVPYPNLGVTKSIHFTKVDGSQCTADALAAGTCYDVSSPSSNSIALDDDMSFLLPSNFLMVGDPAQYSETGIYDVPDAAIAASPNVRAGINHVDYYRMPPGTLETMSLADFNLATGDEYRAQDGSLSAHLFLIGSVLDPQGYPVCDTTGGYPETLNALTTSRTMCPGNATHRSNFTFNLERDDCSLQSKFPASDSFTFYPVLDSSHSYTAGRGVLIPAIRLMSLYKSSDNRVDTTISWWFRMSSDAIAALFTRALPHEMAITIPLLETTRCSVAMVLNRTSGTARLCPRVIVNQFTNSDPNIGRLVIGGMPDRFAGAGVVPCVDNTASDIPHHFFVAVDTVATIGRIRMWIDGNLVQETFGGWNATTPSSLTGTTMSELILSGACPGTGTFAATCPYWPLASPNGTVFTTNGYIPYGAAAFDMRMTKPVTTVTNAHVQRAMACMPPAVFGTACATATPTVVLASHAHRTKCTTQPYPQGIVVYTSVLGEQLIKRTRARQIYDISLASFPLVTSVSYTAWIRAPSRVTSGGTLSTSPEMLFATRSTSSISSSLILAYIPGLSDTQRRLYVCTGQAHVAGSIEWSGGFCQSYNVVVPTDRVIFIALVIASSGVFSFYVNGVFVAHGGQFTLTTPIVTPGYTDATNRFTPFYNNNSTALEYLTIFPGIALTPAHVIQEQQCQITTLFETNAVISEPSWTSMWQAPMGVCVLESPTSTIGTCRTNTLCAGHCVATALVNRTAGTFVTMNHVCDRGYRPPDCVFPCKRIDPVTQLCLDPQSDAEVRKGIVPNGQRCQLLKNFQEYPTTLNGQRILTYTPRLWSYLTTLTVPSGQITSLVPTGTCPDVSAYTQPDGGLAVSLQNREAIATRVLVRFYYTNPAQQSLPTCTTGANQCCDFVGVTVTIPSYTSQVAHIPSGCGNITIFVELATSSSLRMCSALSATAVQLMIETDPIGQAVQQRLTQQVDIVAQNIQQQSASIQQNILHVMGVAFKAMTGSNAAVDYLDNLIGTIRNGTAPVITFAYNLTDAFDLVDEEAEARARAQLAAAKAELAESFALEKNHTENALKLSISIAATDAAIEKTEASLRDLAYSLHNRSLSGIDTSDCGGDWMDVIGCIFEKVADVAVDAANGVAGVASGGAGFFADLLGDGIGGIFDSLFSFIGPLLTYGAIAVGAYFLISWYLQRRSQNRLAEQISERTNAHQQKQQSESEPLTSSTHGNTQSSSHGGFHQNHRSASDRYIDDEY